MVEFMLRDPECWAAHMIVNSSDGKDPEGTRFFSLLFALLLMNLLFIQNAAILLLLFQVSNCAPWMPCTGWTTCSLDIGFASHLILSSPPCSFIVPSTGVGQVDPELG